jgi:hypothetical protein
MNFKLLNKIALVSAFFILISMPAKAGMDFGFGIVADKSDFKTSGSEKEGFDNAAGDGEVSTAAAKTKGVNIAHGFAEIIAKGDDSWLSHLGLSVGIDVIPGEETIRSETRTDTAVASGAGQQATETHATTAKVSNIASIYWEPTLYLNDMIGVYYKAGATKMNVSAAKTGGTSRYNDQTLYGKVTGAGLRLTHSSGIYLKYEHIETDWESLVFKSTSGNENHVYGDVDQESDRIAIGYKF